MSGTTGRMRSSASRPASCMAGPAARRRCHGHAREVVQWVLQRWSVMAGGPASDTIGMGSTQSRCVYNPTTEGLCRRTCFAERIGRHHQKDVVDHTGICRRCSNHCWCRHLLRGRSSKRRNFLEGRRQLFAVPNHSTGFLRAGGVDIQPPRTPAPVQVLGSGMPSVFKPRSVPIMPAAATSDSSQCQGRG